MAIQIQTLEQIAKDTRKTDLCLFTVTIDGGGAERMMFYLADYFAKQGKNVDVLVCRSPKIETIETLLPGNIRYISLGAKKTLMGTKDYLRYLKIARPEVVMSTIIRANIIAGIGRLLSSVKHKTVLRAELSLILWRDKGTKFQPKTYLTPLIKLTYPLADRYIGISDGVCGDLKKLMFISPSNVTRIYNPTLREDFSERLKKEPEYPASIDRSIPIILAASRIAREKDYPTLLRAFKDVLNHRKAQLVIIGDGPLRDETVKMVKDLDIEDHVHFMGFRLDVVPYMRDAHAFVSASLAEGLGNSIIEALASGTHVISTDCPHGPKETLGEGQFGTLFAIGDYQALSQHLIDVLDMPRKAMTPELEKHLEQFRSRNVLPQYEKVLFGE